MAPPAPRISVLITYGDPRQDPDLVANWTRRQTLPADRYEVIVVANRDSRVVNAIRPHLRPADRLILSDEGHRCDMYPEAVAAARGDVLVFTEDHCVAKPRCLEMVADFFQRGDADGASLGWGNINPTAAAAMEEITCAIAFANAPWNKVHLRGFAVRRAALDAVGGFPGGYGPFAEAILAAEFHNAGMRIGDVDEVCVDHVNSFTLGLVFDDTANAIRGECEYITTHDRDFCDTYFHATGVIGRYVGVTPGEAAAAWSAWRQARATPDQARFAPALFREWLRLVVPAARASWGRRAAVRWALLSARLRFTLGAVFPGWRFRGFWDYWRAVVDYTRAEFFARKPLRVWPTASNECPLGAMPATMHPAETRNGIALRWSHPVATFPVRVGGGTHQIGIDTTGARGDTRGIPLWAFWNGRAVAPDRIACDGRWVRVTVTSEDGVEPQPLVLVVPRFDVPHDPRRLGLPVARIMATAIPEPVSRGVATQTAA